MKKIQTSFLVLVFLFSVVSVSLAKTSNVTKDKYNVVVDSYELFWPIVPGKVSGDKLYPLKLFKEKIRESVILSSFKKADYLIVISEKRLVEAEYLYNNGSFFFGQKTLIKLQGIWGRIADLISQSKSSGQSTVNLESRFIDSLGKQKMVLELLLTVLPDSEKSVVNDSISVLENISSKWESL